MSNDSEWSKIKDPVFGWYSVLEFPDRWGSYGRHGSMLFLLKKMCKMGIWPQMASRALPDCFNDVYQIKSVHLPWFPFFSLNMINC